ncbi:MAG: hypothetical protein LLF92_06735 [Planctomycetaceae bacterium]|nr:hypothetical protein [Planctomycetaceae bacterium]
MDLRRNVIAPIRSGIPRFHLILAILMLFAVQSQAIIYWSASSGSGTGFTWANGGSDKGLYGNPEINGNTFEFTPGTDFQATSNGNTVLTYDRLQFDITVDPGQTILGVKIAEQGEYSITGTGSVNAFGAITIINLDQNNKITSSFQTDPTMSITSGSGEWNGQAEVALTGWSHIRVIITNYLTASSPAGSSSYISKNKFGAGTDDDSINVEILIPEPATLAIFALGILIFPVTKRHSRHIAIIAICAMAFMFTNSADAAIDWDTPSGSSTAFDWENGQSDNGLFGQPLLDTDGAFIFAPTNFYSTSASGNANDSLEFDIIAKPGYVITGIGVIESGEYVIIGDGQAEVIASITIQNLVDGSSVPTANINVPISGEGYSFWDGSVSLTDLNLTHIRIAIASYLNTSAVDGYAALVKTTFAVPVTVQALPEPATIALLAFGSLAFTVKKK